MNVNEELKSADQDQIARTGTWVHILQNISTDDKAEDFCRDYRFKN